MNIIDCGSELLRINSNSGVIEYSTNSGRSWHQCYRPGSLSGNFKSLITYAGEILAITSIGIFYSTNKGRTWHQRFRPNSSTGEFIDLKDNGKEVIGITSIGLFWSTNSGRTWHLRKRN